MAEVVTCPRCGQPAEVQTRAEVALWLRVEQLEAALRRIQQRLEAQFRLPSAQPVTLAEVRSIVQDVSKGDKAK